MVGNVEGELAWLGQYFRVVQVWSVILGVILSSSEPVTRFLNHQYFMLYFSSKAVRYRRIKHVILAFPCFVLVDLFANEFSMRNAFKSFLITEGFHMGVI